MATSVFTEGQTIRLRGEFTDASGTPVDPSAITVTVVDPAGTTSTHSASKDDVGIYHADITATVADPDALWRWSMEGTGANPQIAYGAFKVLPAPFTA